MIGSYSSSIGIPTSGTGTTVPTTTDAGATHHNSEFDRRRLPESEAGNTPKQHLRCGNTYSLGCPRTGWPCVLNELRFPRL